MRPGCSTMKRRPLPSFGAAMPTGDERPRAIVLKPTETCLGSMAGGLACVGVGVGEGLFEGEGLGLGVFDFEGFGDGEGEGEGLRDGL
jgi:hypothetical protein